VSVVPPGIRPQQAQAHLADQNRLWPATLRAVPREAWPASMSNERRLAVLRSRDFLVQCFAEKDGVYRLSINRTAIDLKSGRWRDGITWDELQRLKAEAGFGNHFAVEVFPASDDVVNVANVRHLFVLPEPPPFAWRSAAEVQP
jgi:hypothetical protein